MKILSAAILSLCFCFLISGCDADAPGSDDSDASVMYLSITGEIKTLDPVLASDLASQYMTANFYDTLLQYDYLAKPYILQPSMLTRMPLVSPDMKSYKFTLRDDLYFKDDPCFEDSGGKGRKITSRDVIFSILRLADARIHSPGFWLVRGKLRGIDKFRSMSSKAPPGDLSVYEKGCEGLEIIDDCNFFINLEKPDPRLLYALAMPYTSVVPREAVEYYGESFAEHPVGSGPFVMKEWWRNYRIVLERYKGYRREFFSKALDPKDRKRPLPLLDKIVCYLVRQPLSAWLLFLQGELDISSLSKENFDAVVGSDLKLVPALARRGIRMLQVPEFEINYVGFSFTDPLLAGNLKLRKAMSLAYDVNARIKHSNYRLKPANGPIPPGVPGYDPAFANPYSVYDPSKAEELLKEAGFPGGVNPATGKGLELTFDLAGNSTLHRQLGELMVKDMKRIGIDIVPVLNSRPRFFQKLRNGKMQLFRISWVGDYPDAENFLQLFYGRNAGSCNRAFYRDKKYDAMYEEIMTMPDSPERTRKYSEMALYLTTRCPWIFESFPVSYRLLHSWVENYIPHDFAFSRWKYLSVDGSERARRRSQFEPIEMRDLRK